MWVIKGAVLGLTLFSVGTIVFLVAAIGPVKPGTAIAFTTHNVFWYVALVACILLGCSLVASWPVRVQP